MKHLIILLLVFSLLLSGCSSSGDWIKEPVTFYYVCENYQKDMGQVIQSEIREASGHRHDLSYLLALYSMGPSGEDLEAPLPRNTQIEIIRHTKEEIYLHLSDSVLTISDADFTLASACLALTCMGLTDAQQIIIACGNRNITIHEENLLLYSGINESQQEEQK